MERTGIVRRDGAYPGKIGILDDLAMSYNGNQLVNVTDQITNSIYNQIYEFKDNSVSGYNDYAYDANGSQTRDFNKNIRKINYNSLKQATEIFANYNVKELLNILFRT